jgi:hypothetical protein
LGVPIGCFSLVPQTMEDGGCSLASLKPPRQIIFATR